MRKENLKAMEALKSRIDEAYEFAEQMESWGDVKISLELAEAIYKEIIESEQCADEKESQKMTESKTYRAKVAVVYLVDIEAPDNETAAFLAEHFIFGLKPTPEFKKALKVSDFAVQLIEYASKLKTGARDCFDELIEGEECQKTEKDYVKVFGAPAEAFDELKRRTEG